MAAIEELDDSRAPSILGTNIVFLFIGTIGILVRFTARKFGGAPLGLDDLFVFLAWIFFLASGGLTICVVDYGAGRHRKYVLATDPGDLKFFLRIMYAFDIIYPCLVGSIRASICFLYLRVFEFSKALRWYIYSLLAMIGLWTLGVFVISLCQWKHFKGGVWNTDRGTCLNLRNVLIYLSVAEPIFDGFILMAPIHPLWNSKLSNWRKIQLVFLFMLGASEISISIVRLNGLWTSQNSDITWDYALHILLTTAGSSIGLLCACCPVIGTLLPDKSSIPLRKVRKCSPERRSEETEEDYEEGVVRLGPGIMRTISITVEDGAGYLKAGDV